MSSVLIFVNMTFVCIFPYLGSILFFFVYFSTAFPCSLVYAVFDNFKGLKYLHCCRKFGEKMLHPFCCNPHFINGDSEFPSCE